MFCHSEIIIDGFLFYICVSFYVHMYLYAYMCTHVHTHYLLPKKGHTLCYFITRYFVNDLSSVSTFSCYLNSIWIQIVSFFLKCFLFVKKYAYLLTASLSGNISWARSPCMAALLFFPWDAHRTSNCRVCAAQKASLDFLPWKSICFLKAGCISFCSSLGLPLKDVYWKDKAFFESGQYSKAQLHESVL